MKIGRQGLLGCCIVLSAASVLCGEQITSACRITASDAANRTVTLVRKTSSGEKTGVAKVADNANIDIGGKPLTLESLKVPVEASVVYDTELRAVVGIKAAGEPPAGKNEPPRAVAPFDAVKAKEHQKVWAERLGVPVEFTNSIGMKLVLIPPGEFTMGSREAEIRDIEEQTKEPAKEAKFWQQFVAAEAPAHRVRITRAFYFGVYEVTQGQYKRVMGANPSKSPTKRTGQDVDQYPVDEVSMDAAEDFCRRLSLLPAERETGSSYRLPNEAEWEYACRAGTISRYFWGDDALEIGGYAWCRSNFLDGNPGPTHPIGAKRPNPWGLYDICGNVWERCSDWYAADYYGQSPIDDPAGPRTGEQRVVRGGSYGDVLIRFRSALRGTFNSNMNIGLRVVREATSRRTP